MLMDIGSRTVAGIRGVWKQLAKIEENILAMNKDTKLKNRVGPVKIPYTLLCPTSEGGLTGRGIPISVSI
ncbi:hypothetical protein ACOSQ4_008853 [Xanthoceras sorbifolium]